LLLGVQMVTAQQNSVSAAEANWDNFKPETLSGTISMVEPSAKTIFVTGSNEVSYKFLITNKTKIEIGGTRSPLHELASQTEKPVTVTFVARADGNFARGISISG
jgi:hypothetical protein